MLELNEKTKQYITEHLGLEVSKLSEMSAEEIDNYIEKKIGKKLKLKWSNTYA